MGRLPFPPDEELTPADRVVLNLLRKEYESHEDEDGLDECSADAAEDSDNSATKVSKFVSPSPEGTSSSNLASNRQTSFSFIFKLTVS